MVFYETTYILHSALQEGRLNDIVNSIEKKAESIGAEILFSDNWGRKKLSYLIEKEKYGTYIFFQYKVGDISKLSELSSEFEHNPNVLRHLTLEIDKENVKEKKNKEETVVTTTNDKKVSVKEDTKDDDEKKSEDSKKNIKVESSSNDKSEINEEKTTSDSDKTSKDDEKEEKK